MTELTRCTWCGKSFPRGKGPGRPPLYCRRSHRQRAYEARTLGRVHALGSDDVLLARSTLQSIQDFLYELEAALVDVDSDLAETGDHRAALWHLYRVAAEARRLEVEPKAVGSPP
ncbi:MAG: hypothetical protein KatS3mg011_2304 [Acidimicrobiia bacterium]|nr:MAG: hypothetical protein KatS3mg011_2304 [Acidimicrobiia bacterium]